MADYIVQTKGYHCEWALQCLGAQFIYLVNVVGQIFFTDCFLGWEFSKYGVSAASFTELDVSLVKIHSFNLYIYVKLAINGYYVLIMHLFECYSQKINTI